MVLIDSLRDAIDRAIVWGNRAPWLAVRRLLWFFTIGWLLATVYLAAAVAMLASIIFAPFSYQAARLALLAADGGITLEPAADRFVLSLEVRGCVERSQQAVAAPGALNIWQNMPACSVCMQQPSPPGRLSPLRPASAAAAAAAGPSLGQPRAPLHHRSQRAVACAVRVEPRCHAPRGGAGAGGHRHRHRHGTHYCAAGYVRLVSLTVCLLSVCGAGCGGSGAFLECCAQQQQPRAHATFTSLPACRWPFGRGLCQRQLPTTLEELHHQRSAAALESSTARALGWG